jgi:hypothetical protein
MAADLGQPTWQREAQDRRLVGAHQQLGAVGAQREAAQLLVVVEPAGSDQWFR